MRESQCGEAVRRQLVAEAGVPMGLGLVGISSRPMWFGISATRNSTVRQEIMSRNIVCNMQSKRISLGYIKMMWKKSQEAIMGRQYIMANNILNKFYFIVKYTKGWKG